MDLIPSFLRPKQDAESTNDTGTSADAGANATAGRSMELGKKKVETAVARLKGDEERLKATFDQAFMQGNLALMITVTTIGGYQPDGMALDQWLTGQAKKGNEQARSMAGQLGHNIENPVITLPAHALAQVNAIQADSYWQNLVRGQSQSMSLPMQRSNSYSLAV